LERIAVSGQVQVRSKQPKLLCADRGRALVVDLQTKSKGLPVLDSKVEQALSGSIPWLQLRIDLLNIWVLSEELQSILQFVEIQRLARPAAQLTFDVSIAEPPIAVQLRPDQHTLDDLYVN